MLLVGCNVAYIYDLLLSGTLVLNCPLFIIHMNIYLIYWYLGRWSPVICGWGYVVADTLVKFSNFEAWPGLLHFFIHFNVHPLTWMKPRRWRCIIEHRCCSSRLCWVRTLATGDSFYKNSYQRRCQLHHSSFVIHDSGSRFVSVPVM